MDGEPADVVGGEQFASGAVLETEVWGPIVSRGGEDECCAVAQRRNGGYYDEHAQWN